MNALENRVPPPLIALVAAATMWVIARDVPAIPIHITIRLALAGVLAVAGVFLARAGFRAFGRANTTVNPVNIEAASALVTSGVYSYTRNPMYVGLVALLLAWAVYLAVPWTLLGPLVFVLFITRFQIIPEERVLHKKFGDSRCAAGSDSLAVDHCALRLGEILSAFIRVARLRFATRIPEALP